MNQKEREAYKRYRRYLDVKLNDLAVAVHLEQNVDHVRYVIEDIIHLSQRFLPDFSGEEEEEEG